MGGALAKMCCLDSELLNLRCTALFSRSPAALGFIFWGPIRNRGCFGMNCRELGLDWDFSDATFKDFMRG
jgi:hypothetical protein